MTNLLITGAGLIAIGFLGMRRAPRAIRYTCRLCIPIGLGLIIFQDVLTLAVVSGALLLAMWLYNL